MSEPEIVKFDDGKVQAEVRVHRATLLDGVRRSRLIETGKAADEKDIDRWLLRVMIYPDMASSSEGWYTQPGSSEQKVWPPPFEDLAGLPDDLGIAVQAAVYRVNPHWMPKPEGGSRTAPTEKDKKTVARKKKVPTP